MDLHKEIEKVHYNIKAGHFQNGLKKCNALIKNFPENSYLYNLGGLILQQLKRFKPSIEYFQKAISLDSKNIYAKNNLANSFKYVSKFDLSEKLYLEALDADPNYIKCLNNYGNLKQQLYDYKSAVELYNKAISIEPNNIDLLLSLASCYQYMGNAEDTKKTIFKVLNLNPENMSAHKTLSGILNYSEDNEHLNTMEKLSEKKDLKDPQKIDLYFALGKAYEDLKDYDKSFKYLNEANKIQKKKVDYHFKNDKDQFNHIQSIFSKLEFPILNHRESNKKIIFIVGMPRSGTTLVEQIIASHNEVRGAGELDYLSRSIKENIFENNILSKSRIEEEIFLESSKIADDYNKLLGFHKFEEGIITDKAPHNFKWLGVIKLFFKDAKIIHCTRNPKDICLSIFKNFFSSPEMEWSSSQTDIANFYNLYKKTMEFWNKILSDSIYNIKYESLINDQEKEVRSLLKFCDLDFDPQCLNHHKSKKTPIRTVSVNQARKPIYSSSINKNQFYEKNLSEMFSLLDN